MCLADAGQICGNIWNAHPVLGTVPMTQGGLDTKSGEVSGPENNDDDEDDFWG